MSVDLVGLRALAENATPGPWLADGYLGNRPGDRMRVVGPDDTDEFNLAEGVLPDNAQFIAAASPDVVLDLLYENERLWRIIDGRDPAPAEQRAQLAEAALADRDARIAEALPYLERNRGNGVSLRAIAILSAPAVPVPQDNPEATREALADALHQDRHPCGEKPVDVDYEIADAVLATFDVRPKRTGASDA